MTQQPLRQGAPHPFAIYIRTLGRGPSLSRALSAEEAQAAMSMILRGEALPEQIGAFLMLLRMKEETGAEIAGLVRAARCLWRAPAAQRVDLDWPCYAGKKRQPPWFLLAALTLAQHGWRVFAHGLDVDGDGRVHARAALAALGVPIARSLDEAVVHLDARRFAYLSLPDFAAPLADLFALRATLGLRSAVHTAARALNPMGASCSMHGVFHPGYVAIHRDAALTLGERIAVFRGEGGEAERRPNKPCAVTYVADGAVCEDRWPPLTDDPHMARDADMNPARLAALWRGTEIDVGATTAVTGTIAVALRAMGVAETMDDAQARADDLWSRRDRARLAGD